MAEIKIKLKASEREALYRLARRELRDPRAQAAILIRRQLQSEGLIDVEKPKTDEKTNPGT